MSRIICLAAASLVYLAASSQAVATPPNILLILTDDQGWTDSSVQMDPDIPESRSSYYQTPNLQSLADAGMRFSNAYSAAPFCTPSRASLLTGKSPAQLQMTDMVYFQQGSGQGLQLSGPIPQPFDPTQTTLPRMVKQADQNYHTALLGKWHLDLPTSTTPLTSGFDFYNTFVGNRNVDPQGVYGLASLANQHMQTAVDNGKPFFIELAHDAPHELYAANGAPYIPARPEIVEKYRNPPAGQPHFSPEYAALLEDMDTSIGQVLSKIEELGIADNTYVIFTSDNGGAMRWTRNAPLKSGKITIHDGGIRVPFIVKGPGIDAGTFSDVPVSTPDIYSTIASLIGHSGELPEGVEGGDISPVLFNGGELPQGMEYIDRSFSQRGEIYFHYPHYASNSATVVYRPASAVRDGDYKLYVEYDEVGRPDWVKLFNIKTDLAEQWNLAPEMPEKAGELKAMLDNYLTAVDASMPYDVKHPVQLNWTADQPGVDPKGWRSTIDIEYKGWETWALGAGAEQPSRVVADNYQQGLSDRAFAFDGDDVMRRVFFRVGDKGPRNTNITNIYVGWPDYDRSATLDMWFRTSGLNRNQVLFEAGDGSSGLSLTMGDADGDGAFNDLRFRIRSANGQAYDITAPIDDFANPVNDFVSAAAVVNDNDLGRYIELYINGALAGRVDVPTGIANSLHWDGYDQAGLGNVGGVGLGANGGSGNLPFVGSFVGQMAEVNFRNYALSSNEVAQNYNLKLDSVSLGIQSTSGDAFLPAARPTDLRLGTAETANTMLVMEERKGITQGQVSVDAVVNGEASITSPGAGQSGELPSGAAFTSYLLHYDPQGGAGGQMNSVAGSVTFDEQIIAILYGEDSLAASDALLGSIGNYGAMANRGIAWEPGDFLTVSADQRTLSCSLTTPSDDMVQFRVLTGGLQTSLRADFNNDGVVDGNDLIAWQAAFGGSPDAGGDADNDGDVDGSDFLSWQRSLGQSTSAANAGAVPEPSALAAFAIGLLGITIRPRAARRRW